LLGAGGRTRRLGRVNAQTSTRCVRRRSIVCWTKPCRWEEESSALGKPSPFAGLKATGRGQEWVVGFGLVPPCLHAYGLCLKQPTKQRPYFGSDGLRVPGVPDRTTLDAGPEEAKCSLKVIAGFFFLGIFPAAPRAYPLLELNE